MCTSYLITMYRGRNAWNNRDRNVPFMTEAFVIYSTIIYSADRIYNKIYSNLVEIIPRLIPIFTPNLCINNLVISVKIK